MRAVALVLAGGASRRMGVDKLVLPRRPDSADAGQTHPSTDSAVGRGTGVDASVIDHVVSVCRTVAEQVWVVDRPSETHVPAPPADVRVLHDQHAFQGPLAAIASAFRRLQLQLSDVDAVYIVAGDLAGLHPEVLRRCGEAFETALEADLQPRLDAAMVVREGRVQPLIGCYRPEAGIAFQQAVDAGETRLMRVVSGMSVEAVDSVHEGWPEWWTRPIHTPEDYAAWLAEADLHHDGSL